MDSRQGRSVKAIRTVKADPTSLRLQNEFFEKSHHPLKTRPQDEIRVVQVIAGVARMRC
jgi:hypothetical protein